MEDSGDDYDLDMDSRTKDLEGRPAGRVILLPGGTEVLTDSADTEMFDNDEEEKDSKNQVNKSEGSNEARSEREGTPGPTPANEAATDSEDQKTPSPSQPPNVSESPLSTKAEESESPGETKVKAASDTPLSPEQQREYLSK